MSGLVLPVSGEPLKPAPKISGENRRRFYFEAIRRRERGPGRAGAFCRNPERAQRVEGSLASRFASVSEGVAERESAGEILSAGRARRIYSGTALRASELSAEILSDPEPCRRGSKDLLPALRA